MSYVNVLVLLLVACFSQNALAESDEEFEPTDSVNYPKSAALEEMFWNTMEEINQTEPGKLLIRDVRNAIKELMQSPTFWNASNLSADVIRHVTTDPETADKVVAVVKGLAAALNNQYIMERVMWIVGFLLDQSFHLLDSPDMVSGWLNKLADNIENGHANVVVDGLTEKAAQMDLNPDSMVQAFTKFKSTMGKMANKKMNNREADSVIRMAKLFQRQHSI